ncbi:mitoguardin 1 [Gastrophryne carolinensis]
MACLIHLAIEAKPLLWLLKEANNLSVFLQRKYFSGKTFVYVQYEPTIGGLSGKKLKSYPGLKKLIVVAAVGTISVIFLAHHFRRRRGKKKNTTPTREPYQLLLDCTRTAALEKDSSCSSSKQNLTLSLNSMKERNSQLHVNGGLYNKFSGSTQSLASIRSSCHSCACGNSSSWDIAEKEEMKHINVPVTTPENLYLMGMELFEEALRRWEQALTFRNRQVEDETSCSSIRLGAGDAIAEENVEDIISAEFIHKLEALLQRAYRLQEEFEASTESMANDNDKATDVTVMDNGGDFGVRDTLSIASTDSFASAAELSERRDIHEVNGLQSFYHCHCPLYEEAMILAEEGKIHCRALRTEMLECGGDSDFLGKLHCIRQAFQLIISKTDNRKYLIEAGRKVLSALIAQAKKNHKKFENTYNEMIHFLERPESWSIVEMELHARGVKNMNFYDIFLDFIVMDSLEDLENPPLSIQNVVKNRWLNSSFKETAVTSSCWSVLKQKKQQIKVLDGFFAHFYAVCEHISPVLAWGFLGPKNTNLHELCCCYKERLLHFLKDIFDLERVCYTNVENLAEDILQCLHQQMELLETCLAKDFAKPSSTQSCVYQAPKPFRA